MRRSEGLDRHNIEVTTCPGGLDLRQGDQAGLDRDRAGGDLLDQ
jgi:hypothetical protein